MGFQDMRVMVERLVRPFILLFVAVFLIIVTLLSAAHAEATSRRHLKVPRAYRGDRLILITDASDVLGRAIFRRLTISLNTLWRLFEIEKFSEVHRESFWPRPCIFVLFTDKKDYEKFIARTQGPQCLASKAPSYYYVDRDRAVIVMYWVKKAGSEMPTQTLRHEMAHVFLTRYVELRPLPPWIQEGFAQWFEFRDVGKSSRLEIKRKRAKATILRTGEGWFQTLMKKKIISPQDVAAYDESYVVVQFLIKTYRLKRFRAFVLDVAKSLSVPEALEKDYKLSPLNLEIESGLYAVEHY